MPVFTYKCDKCENVQELFQKNNKEVTICKKCGNDKCTKLLGKFSNKVHLNSKDLYEQKIKPEVDQMFERLESGSDSAFLDIAGE